MATPKVFLIILDGFGDGKDYPFNAITRSKMPFYNDISRKFPRAQLLTCGEAVGLPPGVMGNSEVGHTNMGAGRVVYQDLTRINKLIKDGEFQKNEALLSAISRVKSKQSTLHLMGLLSDAGVHSHTDHLKEIIKMAKDISVVIHIFTDGRDTPPTSGVKFVKELGDFIRSYPNVTIGSISGRYYAMDRDNRWDRVEKAFHAITGKAKTHPYIKGNGVGAALKVLEDSYQKNVTDEFIEPTAIASEQGLKQVRDDDAVIFFNYRADRAREITRAFTEESFLEIKIQNRPRLSTYVCLTQYDKKFSVPVAFGPQNLSKILPDILLEQNISQFRIAETEKYAHVTFFFNGGRENPYDKEERLLIASPKGVPTYDLKPEMSAFEVTDAVCKKLESGKFGFVLMNYANPDMVGHTGNFDAAVKALQALDKCLNKAISTALKNGYQVLMTADHGNIEEMRDDHDQPHTQHTLNPVPLHLFSNDFKYKLNDGVLADLAPTILEVMGIKKPDEMTGKSLLKGSRS
ncbi:MAG: 2,3-bisphosphoglycerate-independent phosphoglycerate mutase [Bacteriovoracia bacterium]